MEILIMQSIQLRLRKFSDASTYKIISLSYKLAHSDTDYVGILHFVMVLLVWGNHTY